MDVVVYDLAVGFDDQTPMPHDPHLAETMRDAVADHPGITEKKMFGGYCWMLNGNMLCGVEVGRYMFRVGKEREAAALELGARPLSFTGRKMGGMVELDEGGFADDDLRRSLVEMSLLNAASLPPKG